jgi:hypothetical protein
MNLALFLAFELNDNLILRTAINARHPNDSDFENDGS